MQEVASSMYYKSITYPERWAITTIVFKWDSAGKVRYLHTKKIEFSSLGIPEDYISKKYDIFKKVVACYDLNNVQVVTPCTLTLLSVICLWYLCDLLFVLHHRTKKSFKGISNISNYILVQEIWWPNYSLKVITSLIFLLRGCILTYLSNLKINVWQKIQWKM